MPLRLHRPRDAARGFRICNRGMPVGMQTIHDIWSHRSRSIEDVDRELRVLSLLPADECSRRQVDRLLDERIELDSREQLAEDVRAA